MIMHVVTEKDIFIKIPHTAAETQQQVRKETNDYIAAGRKKFFVCGKKTT
jgi:hypothetical protein